MAEQLFHHRVRTSVRDWPRGLRLRKAGAQPRPPARADPLDARDEPPLEREDAPPLDAREDPPLLLLLALADPLLLLEEDRGAARALLPLLLGRLLLLEARGAGAR